MTIDDCELATQALVEHYRSLQYVCMSNKYRIIGTHDREDWHIVLAEHMRCAPADFYLRDGSGKLCPRWREHYIALFSTEKITGIPESVYRGLKKASIGYRG